MSLCACGSQEKYENCCQPYIEGNASAPTAEKLMRSRYTAFTLGDIRYIERTHEAGTRNVLDVPATEKWARRAEWQGLEIISVEKGEKDDNTGIVEFKARYNLDGEDCVLHEVSDFVFSQGEWFYRDGRLPAVAQYVRETAKVGRNEPCPCGSGKKYKKCCGAA